MIERLKSLFTEKRAASTSDYDQMAQLLNYQLAGAQGRDDLRSSGVYRACLNLIEDASSTAELSGDHSAVLQPHLGAIAREMVDLGQSAFELTIGSSGRLELLPVEVTNVLGAADEASWLYTVTRSGPGSTSSVTREQAAVLNFRQRPAARSPWRGQPSLPPANSTAVLLNRMERQFIAEASWKPSRVISAGMSVKQRTAVSDGIAEGGVVAFPVSRGGTDAKGVNVGTVGGEYSASGVKLHQELTALVCGVMGVPVDLVTGGGSSDSSAKESFRRLAAAKITPLLNTVIQEWERKVSQMSFNLDALRAADEVSRARALGSRSTAVQRLVQSGVDLPQALALAGVD